MAPVSHHLRRQVDRVAHVFQARHPAGAKRRSFHHARVELDLSVSVQARADTGVEQGLVFHVTNGGHRGGQRPVADLGPTDLQSPFNRGLPPRTLG